MITKPRKDIIGNRYGRLTVMLDCGQNKGKQFKYIVVCDCGESKVVVGNSLVTGVTKSCGCIKREVLIAKNYKHGQAYTSKYRVSYVRKAELKRKLRMPVWANQEKIDDIYRNKPDGHEVDHIIPLSGKTVSGLHVHNNLQYLPKQENRLKSNRFTGE
jgi:hypothetical protein